MSLETSGNAIRYAAAEARQIVLAVAHEELEAPIERLTVTDGTITDPVTGRSVTYWELFGGKAFGAQVTGRSQPKGPEAYRIVGHPTARLDLLAKVTGQAVLCPRPGSAGHGPRARRAPADVRGQAGLGGRGRGAPHARGHPAWCATAAFWASSPSARSRPCGRWRR